MEISIKWRVISDWLFVSSHGRRVGGGGVTSGFWCGGGGQQWAGGGNSAVTGGQQRGDGGGGEGNRGGGGVSTVGVSSTSKNRPSQPKYKSPKQFELKGSKSS